MGGGEALAPKLLIQIQNPYTYSLEILNAPFWSLIEYYTLLLRNLSKSFGEDMAGRVCVLCVLVVTLPMNGSFPVSGSLAYAKFNV